MLRARKTATKSKATDMKTTSEEELVITERRTGVWKIKTARSSILSKDTVQPNFLAAPLLFWRLATDIFNISPHLSMMYIAYQIWQAGDSSMMLYLSNTLLKNIEATIVTGIPDGKGLLTAILLRTLFSIMSYCIPWYGHKLEAKLAKEVTLHFELILMKANLDVDLATSTEYGGNSPMTEATLAWQAITQIMGSMRAVLSVFTDLAVIMNSNGSGGIVFALICIAQPLVSHLTFRTIQRVYLAYSVNEDYHRLQNLRRFVDGTFRHDIISGGLSTWILTQYEDAQVKLRGLFTGNPEVYGDEEEIFPFRYLPLSLAGDLPLIFFAANAYYNPTTFSMVSMAILQQSSEKIRKSITRILNTGRRFHRNVDQVKSLYEAQIEIPSAIRAGDMDYPCSDKASAGMGFELRNLSFSYPGAQGAKALNDISLQINRGDLIVVVGANGSGKSTLVRILSRLYAPSSGDLLIDGILASEYRIQDLHKATTLLSQDNLLYPVSLGHNIGLGYPGKEDDEEMVADAARRGGAADFIARLKNGMETKLEPGITCLTGGLQGKPSHPLNIEKETLQKKTQISGGEKQRIAAARAFMRFKTGNVKFVAVDEPSSALDAEGELKLFENLIAVRDGKTMVFVTHRFGHLTKHANQIICMKEGSIIEAGSHDELLKKQGEYAKLYTIQAGAFAG